MSQLGDRSQWYALYTRARAEKRLDKLLHNKGIESYLPLIETLVQRSDRKTRVSFPLLPSYIFVRVSENERFVALNTPGAVRYVSFEGRAVPIPASQIESLQQFIQCAPQDIRAAQQIFANGDWVEITAGPLKGIRGEVIRQNGKQRLLLRFKQLGYGIHIDTNQISLYEPLQVAV